MALLKDFDTDYGIIGNYWKIISNEFIWFNGKYRIIIALFIDKEKRKSNKKPVYIHEIISDNEIKTKKEIYNFLKLDEFFKDSQDDKEE